MKQLNKPVLILDSTLREGEQFNGIYFSITEKIAVAKLLEEFGVNIIEVGHPGISQDEEYVCKQVCSEINTADSLVHARARAEDILSAYRSGATWVGIWASYNDISLKTKFNNKSREWVQEQVYTAINLAKDHQLKVRFTIEDASRTPLHLIHELVETAIKAGANRISLADTVGAWHPIECHKVVNYVYTNFNCEIEVHLHNDLGLAQANAIAAIEAGATVIDVSALGVGERAGICDLFSTCAMLNRFYGQSSYNFKISSQIAQTIARVGGLSVEPHHPIVGKNAFTHVSNYHIKATNKDKNAYQLLNPEQFGNTSKIISQSKPRIKQQRYLNNLIVKKPFIKGSSELLYHRDGVGTRWVFMDDRVDDRSHSYIIERIFDKDYSTEYNAHVDMHVHHCDSTFVFMGNNEDGTGLTVTVTFGDGLTQNTQIVKSPASIFIPAYVAHSYAYVAGIGRFLNFVMAPNYNNSLVHN